MNCLLLLLVISLPDELQVSRKSFSLKDESLIGFSLTEFEEYEGLLSPDRERLRSERFDSSNMRFVGDWPFGNSWSVEVDSARNLAFCGSGGGVYILDISDPAHPVKLSDKVQTKGVVCGLFYEKIHKRLYVAAGEGGGLHIWDVSDSLNPQKLGSYNAPRYVNGVAVSGDFAYVADGDDLLTSPTRKIQTRLVLAVYAIRLTM